jgi:hypothetical protein
VKPVAQSALVVQLQMPPLHTPPPALLVQSLDDRH